MDGYTRTPNQRKILRKTQKDDTYWKATKRILKPKYKISRALVFTFSWPGESNRPLLLHCNKYIKIIIKQKWSIFKILVTVDKHQRFQYFINQTTSIRLEYSSSNAENSFVNNFKIADDFSELRFAIVCKTSQHSIMQFLIGNEMDNDASIAVHLSLGPKVNGQKNLTDFAEFFYQCLVDHGWHASYQYCGNVLSTWIKLKYLIPLKKVNLLYINYCT